MRPTKLSNLAIARALERLGEWRREGDVISRAFRCGSFADAIAFVVRIGFLAEAVDHHPDIDIRYRTVTVALTTHDAGGLTQYDVDLATAIDVVARAFVHADDRG